MEGVQHARYLRRIGSRRKKSEHGPDDGEARAKNWNDQTAPAPAVPNPEARKEVRTPGENRCEHRKEAATKKKGRAHHPAQGNYGGDASE